MSDLLERSRLDGNTVGLGCLTCPYYRRKCSGLMRVGGGVSCWFNCDCDPETCTKACLRKGEAYAHIIREVNGLECFDIGPIPQPTDFVDAPPSYVPMIHNGTGRHQEIKLPWVAVSPEATVGRRRTQPLIKIRNRQSLLENIHVSNEAKVMLPFLGKDKYIEPIWRWRLKNGIGQGISNLGSDWVLPPNYSMELFDPRTHHMFNRKRILMCAHEWSNLGANVIPCIQAVCDDDYQFWLDFLLEHEEISLIYQEFQTGGRRQERGRLYIERMAFVQDALKRPLHFVAVGGFQYRHILRSHFTNWTVIDSSPFMKAHKRYKAQHTDRGLLKWVPARDWSIDELLAHNIRCSREILDETPMRKRPQRHHIPKAQERDHRQASIF